MKDSASTIVDCVATAVVMAVAFGLKEIKSIMNTKRLLLVAVLATATGASFVTAMGAEFPAEVVQFIEDRGVCDHFRHEPRDFDREYLRKGGKRAEVAQQERAKFLEEKTERHCTGMDKRLAELKREYRQDKTVSEKLSQFTYIDVQDFVFTISMHKQFPNAELIQKRLAKIGFRYGVDWFGTDELPKKWTVQIGYGIKVGIAQRIIEACLEFSPQDLGVIIFGKDDPTFTKYRVRIGYLVTEGKRIYEGDSIEKLLSPDLTQEEFEKFAELRK